MWLTHKPCLSPNRPESPNHLETNPGNPIRGKCRTNTCQSSCKVISVLSPIFSRYAYITAELSVHETRWKKSHSNFKLATFRNPWTVSNSFLLFISYRPVSRRWSVYLADHEYVSTIFHDEFRRQSGLWLWKLSSNSLAKYLTKAAQVYVLKTATDGDWLSS